MADSVGRKTCTTWTICKDPKDVFFFELPTILKVSEVITKVVLQLVQDQKGKSEVNELTRDFISLLTEDRKKTNDVTMKY